VGKKWRSACRNLQIKLHLPYYVIVLNLSGALIFWFHIFFYFGYFIGVFYFCLSFKFEDLKKLVVRNIQFFLCVFIYNQVMYINSIYYNQEVITGYLDYRLHTYAYIGFFM
jgi:hypothetical protein